ncbi:MULTISPECIES: CBS domain-containing protein [Rubrivivax]|uniref:CBS domain-containing protein n=1 Tax=Rubrivivax benzoatilyticus TaxID=316997 RepID=A0ABX0HUB1_9BURK|nr:MULTISPECIES: CBS domain-containing protein [Rubrivivax]MCD0418687.1 CBS domain-containing protein [Rubrivivax sp. JA1024]MCC9598674.1 CBS domain-containing protein [Rubrivivax sp. JA1055]MCC9648374.1 CBS domain-containing protein [Rubrivivax sp. JA1029]NHK97093.1 CBS domain-containing protein [Rubrivivax benzoatilyticus]NHL24808.1 CBS domain-containing protein [Rubrivivax benzoatilyticus]
MSLETPLSTRSLEAGAVLAQAQPWQSFPVTLDSAAVSVMTDLTQVKAATVAPGATLRQAEQTMIYQGVRLLFVVAEWPAIEGLITSTDLRGERALRLVQERGLRWAEITVGDAMTPRSRLDAIEHSRLQGARVGHLVATLKRLGRNHLLVVDGGGPGVPPRLRGIVSRSQIERQLGRPVDVVPVATSFADLPQMLA